MYNRYSESAVSSPLSLRVHCVVKVKDGSIWLSIFPTKNAHKRLCPRNARTVPPTPKVVAAADVAE